MWYFLNLNKSIPNGVNDLNEFGTLWKLQSLKKPNVSLDSFQRK